MFIIGMVGPFGSGCSYVAEAIKKSKGYRVYSLSDELRSLYALENPKKKADRKNLQDFGDKVRLEKGTDYLARLVWKKIQEDTNANYIVDSIRNPAEVQFFRGNHADFFLFGVFAEPEERWSRVAAKYDNDKRDFEEDDKRDSGERITHGQRVTDSFRMADIVLLNGKKIMPGNENEGLFLASLREKIDLIERKIPFRPTYIETHMAMAYAVSMRSSCLKRKVGAVIVDDSGNTFSSGYNEVPITSSSCLCEYGSCYRDELKKEYKKSLENIIKKTAEKDKAYSLFKENFKILDYCRALHAEENAIINVARSGTSSVLKKATLFTTTYPCNLCANKIAQVEIGKVVYFEPYPMQEAKKILQTKHITQIPFEGVTYNGYFRLMEVID